MPGQQPNINARLRPVLPVYSRVPAAADIHGLLTDTIPVTINVVIASLPNVRKVIRSINRTLPAAAASAAAGPGIRKVLWKGRFAADVWPNPVRREA